MHKLRIFIKKYLCLTVVLLAIALNEILSLTWLNSSEIRSISLIVLFFTSDIFLLLKKKKKELIFMMLLGGFYTLIGAEVKSDTIFGLISISVGLIYTFLSRKKGPKMIKRNQVLEKKALGESRFHILLIVFFIPFYILTEIFKLIKTPKKLKRKNLTFRNIISNFFVLIIALVFSLVAIPAWLATYAGILYASLIILRIVPNEVSVDGDSMFPTIKNESLANYYWYNDLISVIKKPQRGDIIMFSTGTTVDENNTISTFIKRVIAIPKDKIEIRDGFVYVNGNILDEPYVYKPRSTFARGEFLEECKILEIPDGYVFALGDNRNRSWDSRSLGLISIRDISGIIPRSRQDKYKSSLRDSSHDKESAGLMSFDPNTYYELFNKIRIENGLKPLKENKKLEDAAKKRATAIITNNEFNIPSEESKYPFERAQRDAGYSNILSGEISTMGYFDSEDLANYWMEHDTKISVLEKDYQDMGVNAVIGKVNGCEVQVVVQEFGGYVPPNYNKEDIENWKKELSRLREVQPGWERAKNNTGFYEKNRKEIDRINEIIAIRIANISSIISQMESNRWLTNQQNEYIKQNGSLRTEQQNIALFLNAQRR